MTPTEEAVAAAIEAASIIHNEDGSTSISWSPHAAASAAINALAAQGAVTDETIVAAIADTGSNNPTDAVRINQAEYLIPAVRSLLAQQAAVKDAENERLRTPEAVTESLTRLAATTAQPLTKLRFVYDLAARAEVAESERDALVAQADAVIGKHSVHDLNGHDQTCLRCAYEVIETVQAENAELRRTLDKVRGVRSFRNLRGVEHVYVSDLRAILDAAPSPEPQPLDERESQEAEYTRLRAAADRLADAMPERSNECVRGYYPGKDDPEDEAAAGCLTHNRPWHDCQNQKDVDA